MKITYIATYPPRECGIGTFTNNLFKSMLAQDGHEGFVVAMNVDKRVISSQSSLSSNPSKK